MKADYFSMVHLEDKRKGSSKGTSEEFAETLTSLPANLEQRILDVTDRIQVKAKALRDHLAINWTPYMESGLIFQKDYAFIAAIQTARSKKERDKVLDTFGDEALQSLMSVVQRVCIVDEIQKFLILIDDMLWEDMNRVERFRPGETEPWRPFLDLLTCSDELVRNLSSRIIVVLICHVDSRPKESDLAFYLRWLKGEMRRNNTYLLTVARCLQMLLRVDKYRLPFLNIHGIFRIIRLLTEGIKPQAQYQFVFCLWMGSFNRDVVEKMNGYSTISVLTKLLECAPAEIVKLPRIIMATFRNMLEKPTEEGVWSYNALLMVQYKLLKCIEVLKPRHATLNDPEHMEDILAIESILEKYVAKLSTFDAYRLEVKSLRLEWSVVHSIKSFWIENAHRLCENDFELVRILVQLLQEEAQEKVVLCVAAHDLGEFMSQYTRGKKAVVQLGGKDALLGLLKHSHPMVKFHALKCLQILMLDSYDLLSEYDSDFRGPNLARSYLKRNSARKALFGM